jgi:glyoxylase-like metal-dependent hydrolase (beta-lactamase superfamily II)
MGAAPETMIGLELPDVEIWSERVIVVRAQNPGIFTGPGTNTYLIGTGAARILLDTGEGVPAYLPVLERALEDTPCRIQEIVLTHGHVDHMGGVPSVLEHHGPLRVSKLPQPGRDACDAVEVTPLEDGAVVRAEGATLRALHTPGHAADHLCFALEEERAIFSGDNVLGVGTTFIPIDDGDLNDYLRSLERLLDEAPGSIYPAHGPRIPDGAAKIREYIAHRIQREGEILDALERGASSIREIVELVYVGYPAALRSPARHSVCSHLLKLEREARVHRSGDDPLEARWALS